jgi:hypothetical protein
MQDIGSWVRCTEVNMAPPRDDVGLGFSLDGTDAAVHSPTLAAVAVIVVFPCVIPEYS